MFKIFGFQKGKIDIKLSEFNYSPGDVIEGTVEVEFKTNIASKELSIAMLGEEVESQTVGVGTRGRSSNSRRTIFNFKQPLEGEKEYSDGDTVSYPFQIKIPEDILEKGEGGGLEKVASVLRVVSGSRRRIDWKLVARVSAPGFDMKKKIQINIA